MPTLDHLSVIAPTLTEGVAHIRECLDVDIPFGRKHAQMGTHNHLLALGESVYLEVIAIDEQAPSPSFRRWFGLDRPEVVRKDWDDGRRLRGWVARTDGVLSFIATHEQIYEDVYRLSARGKEFLFSIPRGFALPADGIAPLLIDRQGTPPSIPADSKLGCRLSSFTVRHPDVEHARAILDSLEVEGAPEVVVSERFQLTADIETPAGVRRLF